MEYTLHIKGRDQGKTAEAMTHIREQIRNHGKAIVFCQDPNTILGMFKQVFDEDLVYNKKGNAFHFHK